MMSARRALFLSRKFQILFLMACTIAGDSLARPSRAADKITRDPWEKSQIILPEELNKLLSAPVATKPRVICVAFEFLYKGAHISGAKFLGPGRDSKAIEGLKKWAEGIARDQEVVIYCGCCPMKDCPNIRPAYEALRQAGLTHLKVLDLKNSFARDWVDKGFPIEKGAGN